jgi:hypothetical protein
MVGLALMGLVVAAPSAAQETEASVLSSVEVTRLLSERSDAEAERRTALTEFLGKSDVRRIAASAGIDIRNVQSAAATLSDEEVRRIEPRLHDAEHALAGGDTLVISSTVVIIGLLILIIILVS